MRKLVLLYLWCKLEIRSYMRPKYYNIWWRWWMRLWLNLLLAYNVHHKITIQSTAANNVYFAGICDIFLFCALQPNVHDILDWIDIYWRPRGFHKWIGSSDMANTVMCSIFSIDDDLVSTKRPAVICWKVLGRLLMHNERISVHNQTMIN